MMNNKGLHALLIGFVAAVICLIQAFFAMGAGHGWNAPFRISLIGFFVFPFAFWAVRSPRKRQSRLLYGVLLALALASDFQLYRMTDAEGWQYVHRAAPFSFLWLVIWSLWQLAVLFAFMASFRKRTS
ncbi:hypothetical protein [Sphingopyxis sp. LK2115]|jgi:hypothetical protein|uniref:hypothetical protein n=1 Tax=Sphingopyxis sp. LK2115 TaxID=2744558 RepID=UPI00166168CE|nr:hypothetical protein [Sphingopyxis sp. LK2115]